MNVRLDKVVRVVGPGIKRVYSLVLTDAGLCLIQTGHVGALKHYRRDDTGRLVCDRLDDRRVREIQIREGQIDTLPLDELLQLQDNYFIRWEALEDVELRPNKKEPEMWLGVTGSEHHLFFPCATWDEVEVFQRALSKWLAPR